MLRFAAPEASPPQRPSVSVGSSLRSAPFLAKGWSLRFTPVPCGFARPETLPTALPGRNQTDFLPSAPVAPAPTFGLNTQIGEPPLATSRSNARINHGRVLG